MAKGVVGCNWCTLECVWRNINTTCEHYCSEPLEETTACEEQCGNGCYPGCMGNACVGCTHNPESLY